ncbi:unnamed protein product [Urochloa humidicola]
MATHRKGHRRNYSESTILSFFNLLFPSLALHLLRLPLVLFSLDTCCSTSLDSPAVLPCPQLQSCDLYQNSVLVLVNGFGVIGLLTVGRPGRVRGNEVVALG